jgi:probable rRNA maturation factor
MKIDLEINNTTSSLIEAGFFETVAKRTFAELDYNFLENAKAKISVALVSKKEIRKLNKEYRKNDNVTDILSFPEYKSSKEIENFTKRERYGEVFLGELILCYDDIKEYADKESLKLEKELAKVVTHGILHLVGIKHGEKMFKIQEIISNKK